MMSGYTAMLCLLPAFLAAIISAFGLRAAYVRSSRAVSVWSEGVAVLLSSDLLLSCFKLREWAAGHEDAPFFLYAHIVLLAAATCLILLSLYQLRPDAVTKRGLLRASLLLAAVLLDFGAAGLPWGIALASLLLVLRAGLAWHHARPAVREWVREGLDTLPEGILFAHGDGRIVLANLCMLDFMEGTVGGHSRDAEAFWQRLREMAQQGDRHIFDEAQGTLLFRFRHSAWLLRRKAMPGRAERGSFEITASDVTELDAVTRELEAKNAVLAAQAEETKRLLQSAIEEERRRTLETVRVRVHDIMGSRISMLQRLLTAPEPLEAAKLVPTVDMVLEEIWLEEESPQELLQDLVRAYEAFGVTVRLMGKLPERRTVALAFVEVLREAATNAICHGHADVIEVKVGEAGIRIADNGCGAPPTFHPGGGLSAIIRRAKSLDARLTIAPQPSFSLALTMPAPGRASEPAP